MGGANGRGGGGGGGGGNNRKEPEVAGIIFQSFRKMTQMDTIPGFLNIDVPKTNVYSNHVLSSGSGVN